MIGEIGGMISVYVMALCMTTYWKYCLVGLATYFILSNSSGCPSVSGIASRFMASMRLATACCYAGVDFLSDANWKCLISSAVGNAAIQKHSYSLDLWGNNTINLGDDLSLPTNLAMATFLVAINAVINDAIYFLALSESTGTTISMDVIK